MISWSRWHSLAFLHSYGTINGTRSILGAWGDVSAEGIAHALFTDVTDWQSEDILDLAYVVLAIYATIYLVDGKGCGDNYRTSLGWILTLWHPRMRSDVITTSSTNKKNNEFDCILRIHRHNKHIWVFPLEGSPMMKEYTLQGKTHSLNLLNNSHEFIKPLWLHKICTPSLHRRRVHHDWDISPNLRRTWSSASLRANKMGRWIGGLISIKNMGLSILSASIT